MAGTESPGYPGVVAGRNTTTEVPDDIGMDQDSRALYVGSWVWNTSTLSWEKAQSTQASFSALMSMNEEILTQLKIMNLYLSDVTGNVITEEDV